MTKQKMQHSCHCVASSPNTLTLGPFILRRLSLQQLCKQTRRASTLCKQCALALPLVVVLVRSAAPLYRGPYTSGHVPQWHGVGSHHSERRSASPHQSCCPALRISPLHTAGKAHHTPHPGLGDAVLLQRGQQSVYKHSKVHCTCAQTLCRDAPACTTTCLYCIAALKLSCSNAAASRA